MNNIIKRTWKQSGMVYIEDLRGAAFTAENGGHTFQISGEDETGATIALSGTVTGTFVRSDMTTVAISGSATGGVVSLTLSAECYGISGRFGLTIFLTSDGQKTAVYSCVGDVAMSGTSQVSPGVTADVVDLINRINTAVATIPASYAVLMGAVAQDYSTAKTYRVGDYVWYNGQLFRCYTAITTPETWNPLHWAPVALGDRMGDVERDLDSLAPVKMSQNLVSLDAINDGKDMDTNSSHATYGELTNSTLAITTDFFPVVAGTVYYSTVQLVGNPYRKKQLITRIGYYYDNKTVISASTVSADNFTPPTGAKFARVTLRSNDGWTKQMAREQKWMIFEANSLYGYAKPYEEFYKKLSVPAENVNSPQKIADLFTKSYGKNLLVYDTFIDYSVINSSNGVVGLSTTGCSSDYVPVKPSSAYFTSNIDTSTGLRKRVNIPYVVFYNANKEFISSVSNVYTFTTPGNAAYCRFSWSATLSTAIRQEKFMLEAGSNFSMYEEPDGEFRIAQSMLESKTRKNLDLAEHAFYMQKHKQFAKRFMKIAHRGVMYGIPQNTIPAFEYAARQGCDYVEFDIRKTVDNEFVIYHDKDIILGGTVKNIIDCTLEEIKAYRFASYAGTPYEDTEIPTLEETLQCFVKNNIKAFPELKNSVSELSDNDIQAIYDIFDEYGLLESTIFTTDISDHKERLLRINNFLNMCTNFKANTTLNNALSYIRVLVNGKNTIVCALPVENLTASNVAALKEAGADFIMVGHGLGGTTEIPDALIKYVHYTTVEFDVPLPVPES